MSKFDKYKFKNDSYVIQDEDMFVLTMMIKRYNIKSILEFGCGVSTLFFNDLVDYVISIEMHEEYMRQVHERYKALIFLWDYESDFHELSKLWGKSRFDMVFIDGPEGGENREPSFREAVKRSDIIAFHDCNRQAEKAWAFKYLYHDFRPVMAGRKTEVWKRL